MTTCQHDPMFTTDGRCSKCYPPKRVVMVQHDGGAQEVHPGWLDDWQHGERGAGCAGNDADTCEAGGFG